FKREDITSRNGQTRLSIIISLLFFVVLTFLISSKLLPTFSVVFVLASLVFVIAFINTDVALIILIFSMLLSPEFKIGGITGRDVVIRIDDVFLFVVFLGWLAKMAVHKELSLLRTTPINKFILIYIFIGILATLLGAQKGYVNTTKGFFYILKYIEYFLLFFLVANNIRDMKQIKIFVFFILLTCFMVSAYAWYLHLTGVERVAAPFDLEGGSEANTLAGYLLLIMGIIMGLLIYSTSYAQKILLSAFLGFIVPPFLFTLSRGAWLGLIPMYISLIILTKKSRHLLLVSFVIIVILSPILLPQTVKDRITTTFVAGEVYTVFGKQILFAESAAARIEVWKYTVKKWYKRPFLGYGVTGIGFVDSQYARILGETGLIGFLVFALLMATIFREGVRNFKLVEDDWARGLTLGFLAGLTGLLFQAFSASNFIIVRIMEPFWFIAAIVIMLPVLRQVPEKKR
ncbi:MAG: O-antigen ligase family protein, partial [Thermodesulfovibrionia bacterium]|nr:O-antigen ligase family protein [Thermodesulfovibrionia bacterium]